MDEFTKVAAWTAGAVVLLVIIAILVGALWGCEAPPPVTVYPTTMPSEALTTPEQIVAAQRQAVNAILASYLVEQANVAKDDVEWFEATVNAHVWTCHVIRTGKPEEVVAGWQDTRKRLEARRAELAVKRFELLAALDRLLLEMAQFDAKYPGWWLMGPQEKK